MDPNRSIGWVWIPSTESSAMIPIVSAPGAVYRVEVAPTLSPSPTNCQCPHYRLEFLGALEAGLTSPSIHYLEGASKESTRWVFNVAPGEPLDVSLLPGLFPPNPMSPSDTPQLILIDPQGQVRLNDLATPPPSLDLPREIHIPDAGDTPGPWVLSVNSPEIGPLGPPKRYRIDKFTGADQGIYVVWFTEGFATVRVHVVQGPEPSVTPFLSPVALTVTIFGSLTLGSESVTDGIVFDHFPVLPLLQAHAVAPPGWTPTPADQSFVVTCDGQTDLTIRVQDLTPPNLSCVQSVNPSGANVPNAANTNEDGFYLVSATDLVTTSPRIMLGSYSLVSGETIKITQRPEISGVTLVGDMGQPGIKHFLVGRGDAVITATDQAGNAAARTCLVPPPPK